ncbi:MAG: regulatory protein RecX [Patescibacteria group bacterium]
MIDEEQPKRAQWTVQDDEDKQVQKALSLSYFFLKFRPRSEWELRTYLLKKSQKFRISEQAVEHAISELKELRYLNDTDFIAWYVDYQRRIKHKGDRAIRKSLSQLRLPKHLVDRFFLNDNSDAFTLAQAALRPKWRTYARLEKRKRFQRAAAYLQRRGYPYDIIVKVVELMEKDQ